MNKFFLMAIVIIIAVIAYLFFGDFFFRFKKNTQFPPSNIQCFDSFMEISKSGYLDGFRIPPFDFSGVSYFRCASQIGFSQYEISGIDKEGHSFYVHKDEGGMAASGSDTIYNLCYKQDNIIIRNDKFVGGPEPIKEQGTCFWTDNFPLNPTSTYKYEIK